MPEKFGSYTVFDELGVGGMASVHVAQARDGKRVALKRLLPYAVTEAESVRTFMDEARLVRHLEHPNVAATYDSGKIDGTYYIAMEYVEGHTLGQLIRRCAQTIGVMPFPITVNILIQLCDALDYAHKLCDAQGKPLKIIHRDVSPQNVILSKTGIVKLIDWGIAKTTSSTVHSHAGVVKGKFGYMAPEYLDGKLDHRVDLWALGTVAHELLTNRRLFDAADDFKTMYSVKFDKIDPPSKYNADVPHDFDVIVMTALQRDPDRRWQSAAAMRTALCNAEVELQTRVTNVQLIEWVDWTFTQAPVRDGTGLYELMKALDRPSRAARARSLSDGIEELVISGRTPTPPQIEVKARRAASEPAPAAPRDEVAAEGTAPTTVEPARGGAALQPQPPSRLATLLFLALIAGGFYAAWHYGYMPAEITKPTIKR